MCSICGMYGQNCHRESLDLMNTMLSRRGPDSNGRFEDQTVAFGHNRLAVIDLQNGAQPMTVKYENVEYTIVYNGEIYNQKELNEELTQFGVTPNTQSDTETVLWTYILFGDVCPSKLNGIFAFAIYNHHTRDLFICRDRLGVKPLFYTECKEAFVFASEIKSLLAYPGIRAEIDREALWELLYLTPVTFPYSGIFKNIHKLLPGEYVHVNDNGIHRYTYWKLEPKQSDGSRSNAIQTVRELVIDAVERQLVSDVPLCTLLSGGLDSSVITSIAASCFRKNGCVLDTYSFEYDGNREHFKKSLFQPESDDYFASWLAKELQTSHTVLTASSEQVYSALSQAVDARDLPGQADIDSSLLYFCSQIKRRHTVALSGECSDEIFGGYPWFYRPEMLERPFFPWIHDPMARISLFKQDIVQPTKGYDAISEKYKDFLKKIERADSDSDDMYHSRIATQLSVYFFMQSLLERKDRMSMYSAVEVRVPFADHRIIEYVYNVPWEWKYEHGVEKSLLRNAMKGVLPERVLYRKKSPYPKTHDPLYEQLTREVLLEIVKNPQSRLHAILDSNKMNQFMNGEDKTWFGQLMSRPQLYAWLIQFEYWLNKYSVSFSF